MQEPQPLVILLYRMDAAIRHDSFATDVSFCIVLNLNQSIHK